MSRCYWKAEYWNEKYKIPSKDVSCLNSCRLNTELKYFAIVLADEKNEFAYRTDMLAFKKTANESVFKKLC